MTSPTPGYMDPARREHFVYRAYDAAGQLLYVGCTLRPSLRYQEHKGQSRWFCMASSFKMQGPYNYETARRLEREAIHSEHPIHNSNEPRRFRVGVLRNRISKRWFNQLCTEKHWTDAVHEASAHTEIVIPSSWLESGEPVTEWMVSRAEKAERDDAELLEARRSA